jgi:hypothetical protein
MEHSKTRIVIQPPFGVLERMEAARCASDHAVGRTAAADRINSPEKVAKSIRCFKIGTREGNLDKNEHRSRSNSDRDEKAERVPETEPQVDESRDHQILFPMAVGALFLVVLVVGALLG